MTIHEGVRWADLFSARTAGEGDDAIARIMALSTATDLISFSGGFPDPVTVAAGALPQLLAEILADGGAVALQYAPTAGLPSTRDFLRDRLAAQEGHRPGEDELMMTSGGIEALGLVATCFLDAGDVAVTEAPTYLGALMSFRGQGARIETVGLDADGMVVEELAGRLAAGLRPKLVYAIPDHQNPAGVTMSAERRSALVALARRYGFLVVEDVAYRELGFDGNRLPSLWAEGPDVVLQAGTFSKTFSPGTRLGWAAGPPAVLARLVVAKQCTDQCAGALGQRLLEAYGRSGHLDAQVERSRALYGHRCALLLAALERHLPPTARWTTPRGGFFSWLTLPPGHDSVALAETALAHGVAYVPGVPFFPDGRGTDSLRLSFSRVSDDAIEEGVRRLAALLGQVP
ncbi:MAG: PLP-dependent aminotransferase family protein [Frankiaceae bacterium]